MNVAAAIRRLCGGALVACFTADLAALTVPVDPPEGREGTDPLRVLPSGALETAHEDLGAFVASRRWGVSLQDIWDAEATKARLAEPAETAEPAEPSINPTLAKMGFVGLIVTKEQSAVLLASPDGGVARIAPGDTLPDGRTLVSVTDNSLTLRSEALREEVLSLSPRVRMEPPAGERGDTNGPPPPGFLSPRGAPDGPT